MVDGAIGTVNLQQQTSFSANPALTLGGGTLNFELGSTAADQLVVGAHGQASVSGTNTIAITPIGSTLTAGGTYPLISAPAGGLTGTFQFANGSPTTTVNAGGSFYTLTLSNTNSTESVSVAKATVVPQTMY